MVQKTAMGYFGLKLIHVYPSAAPIRPLMHGHNDDAGLLRKCLLPPTNPPSAPLFPVFTIMHSR